MLLSGQINRELYRDRQEAECAERLARIKRAWDYYEGRHPKPLLVRPGQQDDNVIVNLARPIVDKGIALLFGKEVLWQVDETGAADTSVEKHLTAVWDANDKMALLHELGQNGALSGMAFVKIDPQPGDLPRLINLDPATVSLAWSPGDIEDIWRYRIEFTADRDGEEIQYRQDIERLGPRGALWRISDYEAEAGKPYQLVDQRDWPYPWPPVVHCKNLPCANAVWGYGDLEDVALNDALNLIASSTRKILRLHAHPKTFGKGFHAKDLESWGPGDMWTVENPDADVKNLEMQSDLSAARQFYQDLRAAFYTAARMPDIAQVGNLGALTNFGLRVLFADALERTETKRVFYGGLIKRLNRRLAELGGYGPDVIVTLTWPDPLPVNMVGTCQAV